MTRGQFRLLLLLLLIQVVVTVQSTYAPGFVAWAKERWAEHQRAVAHRAKVRQNFATMGRSLAYAEPAGKVVWDEDPARAAALLVGAGYRPIPFAATDAPWFVVNAIQPGAAAVVMGSLPDAANWLFQGRSATALVLMHGRRPTGGGAERLVVVTVGATAGLVSPTNTGPGDRADFSLYKVHGFTAESFGCSAEGEGISHEPGRCELSIGNNSSGVEIPAHWIPPASPGEPGSLRIEPREQLRVFAGQADPADASHFIIAYDLDGRPGVIDGWLKADGSVQLEPRVGKRVNAIWYPYAKR